VTRILLHSVSPLLFTSNPARTELLEQMAVDVSHAAVRPIL
jgi:hypothetical protein